MKSVSRTILVALALSPFAIGFSASPARAQAQDAPARTQAPDPVAHPQAQDPVAHAQATGDSAPRSRGEDDKGDWERAYTFETLPDEITDFRDKLRFEVGPLRLSPVVLMQVQALPYVGADSYLQTGDPSERAGFRIRRARLGFDGRLYKRIPFAITAEFANNAPGVATLHDAWFGYDSYKALQIFVGAHDVPFSRSAMTGSGDSSLADRPLAVRAMAPGPQVGVHLEGHLWSNTLNYYAGVYNALQRTPQFYDGFYENAALLGNRFDGLMYVGRLSTEPFGSLGRTIEDEQYQSFRFEVGASAFYSNGGTINVTGFGADLLVHFRGLHVLGEFLSNNAIPAESPTQPTTQIQTVQSLAAVGEVGYMLLRDRLGLNCRFEWIIPNTSVQDQADNWLLTGGLSLHLLHDLLKAQLEYTHRQVLYGPSLKEDNAIIQLQLHL